MNKKHDAFVDLLQFFPIIEPPITLSEESSISFSSENKAIPMGLLVNTIGEWESLDEFSEIIPCFRLNLSKEFLSIVYWKGGLMIYEYILVNYLKDGTVLSKKVIAGTISNGQTIKKSVAFIDEDFVIKTAVGESSVHRNYNPENTKTYNFEILGDGIISSTEEDNIWEEKIKKGAKN